MAEAAGGTAVKPGDVWRVGQHVLACADGEAGGWARLVDLMGRPDVVYVDPPWGAALATGYRTKAGVPRRVDYDAFLGALMGACALSRGDVWMEQGRSWEGQTVAAAEAAGLAVLSVTPIVYYRKYPALLIHMTADANVRPVTGWEEEARGKDDDFTPFICLRAAAAAGKASVFDPCTGKGLTSRAAAAAGLDFFGMELGPTRLSVAVSKLALLTGTDPVLLGAINP